MGRWRRALGLRLARFRVVRQAIAARADLRPFRRRPSLRLGIGLGLLGLSLLLGWPAVAALATVAYWLDEPLIGLVGGPAIYGFSWVIYLAALWLTGREALFYAGVFNRWALRRLAERLIGQPPLPPAPVAPAAGGANSSSDGSMASDSSSRNLSE